MKQKSRYESPSIQRVVHLQIEDEILAASTVDLTAPIISNGQEVVDIDAGSTEFDWNNNWTWSN